MFALLLILYDNKVINYQFSIVFKITFHLAVLEKTIEQDDSNEQT